MTEAALENRYRSYAAKWVAEWDGVTEPTDEALTECFKHCVRPGHPDEYDTIRSFIPAEAAAHRSFHDDEPGGITPEAQADGHRYVMGNVNAHCPRCASLHYEETGELITVLSCRYDTDA